MAAKKKRGTIYHRVVLDSGEVRWRFRVDLGVRPDGKRDQRTITCRTKEKAIARRSELLADKARGVLVRPSELTTCELFTNWLQGKKRIKAGTRYTYKKAADLWLSRFGDVPAQKLTKKRVDEAAEHLQANGRRVGNRQRQDLTIRTLQIGLGKLKAAFTDAMHQGLVQRNVFALVELAEHQPRRFKTWTADQLADFFAYLVRTDDRDYALYRLSAKGLRRGEVLGARWDQEIDLTGDHAVDRELPYGTPSILVAWTRGLVGTEAVEGSPKTARSVRVVVLDEDDVKALTTLRDRQDREAAEAGSAYAGPCELCGGRHVYVDALGRPPWPQSYGTRFNRLVKAAGLPSIRLHDLRHTFACLLRDEGVPMATISSLLGHVKPSFTSDVYGLNVDRARVLPAATDTLRAVLARAANRQK